VNGAILGMKKAEVKAKFEKIVAFAEIERFLDTPVKRYSSGTPWRVRLAFAVAAPRSTGLTAMRGGKQLAGGEVVMGRKEVGV